MSSRPASTPRRPRGRPSKTRPALLEAAIREFAEKGYAGATTAGIARRARSNQPLVHHHFGSKEELFRTVLDTLFDELRQHLFGAETGALDARGVLRRFVLFTAARPELARIWVIESARGGRHVDYMFEKHVRPLTEQLLPQFAAVAPPGLVANDEHGPHLIALAIQGFASFPFLVSEQIKRFGLNPRSPDFANAYADLVVALVSGKAPQEPPTPAR